MIRFVNNEDINEITEIYNYYVLNTTTTFETSPVSKIDMQERINSCIPELPWLVYEKENQILGYVYAIKWKPRNAYIHSVEISIYLKHGESKKGLGTLLYQELIKQLIILDYHAIIGGIAIPNDTSIALHEKLGFKKVAHFKEVGYKFKKWVDVGYWQLLVKKEPKQ